MSASYSEGGLNIARERGSQVTTSRAPMECAASDRADMSSM